MKSFFKYLPAGYLVALAIFSFFAHEEDYFEAAFACACWAAFHFFLLYTYFARADMNTRARVVKAGSRDWKIMLSVLWMFPLTLASGVIGTKFGPRWGWLSVAFVAVAPVVLMLIAESRRKKPTGNPAGNPADVLRQVDTLMAYGRNAQAIRSLEDALTVWPEQPVLLQKLAGIRSEK